MRARLVVASGLATILATGSTALAAPPWSAPEDISAPVEQVIPDVDRLRRGRRRADQLAHQGFNNLVGPFREPRRPGSRRGFPTGTAEDYGRLPAGEHALAEVFGRNRTVVLRVRPTRQAPRHGATRIRLAVELRHHREPAPRSLAPRGGVPRNDGVLRARACRLRERGGRGRVVRAGLASRSAAVRASSAIGSGSRWRVPAGASARARLGASCSRSGTPRRSRCLRTAWRASRRLRCRPPRGVRGAAFPSRRGSGPALGGRSGVSSASGRAGSSWTSQAAAVPSGRMALVWASKDAGEGSQRPRVVRAALRPPGGRFGAARVLDPGEHGPGAPSEIGLAIACRRSATAVWANVRGCDPQSQFPVRTATAPPAGGFGPVTTSSPPTERGSVSAAPDGRTLVTWSTGDLRLRVCRPTRRPTPSPRCARRAPPRSARRRRSPHRSSRTSPPRPPSTRSAASRSLSGRPPCARNS